MMIFIANAKSLQPGYRAMDIEELDIDALFSAALEEDGNENEGTDLMDQLENGLDLDTG